MDAAEAAEARALARGRAAALVAELWARGLTADTAAAWAQVPAVAPLLPAALDPDEAAAEHQRVAQAELFPYEGVFLHPEGLLGGEAADALRRLRDDAGLAPPRELEPDHLAEELRLLAWLAGIERLALRGEAELSRVHEDQRRLLDEHLLRWLPGFAAVVAEVDPGPDGQGGVYAAATRLALDLAVDWRRELGGEAATWDLPPAPADLLDQERTGLAAISRHLCVPAMAGGFLSAGLVRRLGRDLDLPRGFGKRWQQLESLLSSAAHYSAVPTVLGGLLDELDTWDAAWAALDGPLAPIAAPWRARIATSRAMVARIHDAATTPGDVPD